MRRWRVIVVDDLPLVREGVRRVLESEPDIEVVADSGGRAESVRAALDLKPDVLILGLAAPEQSGRDLTGLLHSASQATRVIGTVGDESRLDASAALELGLMGLLPRSAPAHEVVDAVRAVCAGRLFIEAPTGPTPSRKARPQAREMPTARELDVLRLVADGDRDRDIAAKLCLADGTVRFHLGNLFAKAGATSRTELVSLARRNGWL